VKGDAIELIIHHLPLCEIVWIVRLASLLDDSLQLGGRAADMRVH
jgi:hypothetical protein